MTYRELPTLRSTSPTGADQRVYRLSEPITYDNGCTSHVVVSAVTVVGRPETFIFPSDPEGNVLDWGELEGSFQGGLDHEEAINGLVEVAS